MDKTQILALSNGKSIPADALSHPNSRVYMANIKKAERLGLKVTQDWGEVPSRFKPSKRRQDEF